MSGYKRLAVCSFPRTLFVILISCLCLGSVARVAHGQQLDPLKELVLQGIEANKQRIKSLNVEMVVKERVRMPTGESIAEPRWETVELSRDVQAWFDGKRWRVKAIADIASEEGVFPTTYDGLFDGEQTFSFEEGMRIVTRDAGNHVDYLPGLDLGFGYKPLWRSIEGIVKESDSISPQENGDFIVKWTNIDVVYSFVLAGNKGFLVKEVTALDPKGRLIAHRYDTDFAKSADGAWLLTQAKDEIFQGADDPPTLDLYYYYQVNSIAINEPLDESAFEFEIPDDYALYDKMTGTSVPPATAAKLAAESKARTGMLWPYLGLGVLIIVACSFAWFVIKRRRAN